MSSLTWTCLSNHSCSVMLLWHFSPPTFLSISKDFPFASCIPYRECSTFELQGCTYLSPFKIFQSFGKKKNKETNKKNPPKPKNLSLLQWNTTHSNRRGLNYIFRFPNEVIPGLKCYTHLIWLVVQRRTGTHRKLWTPDAIRNLSLAQRARARPMLCLGIT